MVHHQDDIGRSGDDRLVRKLLVSGKPFDRVGRAGQRDDTVGPGMRARRHDLAALHRQDEQNPFLPVDACRARLGCLQLGLRLGGERSGLVFDAQRLADHAYPFENALVVVGLGHLDIGNARLFQHVHRFPRAAALQGDDAGGIDRQDALGRKRAHIADVGQRLGRFRIGAGGVARYEMLLLAQREDDLGHGAADGDDPRRVGKNRRILRGGGPRDRSQRQSERGQSRRFQPYRHVLPLQAAVEAGSRGRFSARKRQSARSTSPSWR